MIMTPRITIDRKGPSPSPGRLAGAGMNPPACGGAGETRSAAAIDPDEVIEARTARSAMVTRRRAARRSIVGASRRPDYIGLLELRARSRATSGRVTVL